MKNYIWIENDLKVDRIYQDTAEFNGFILDDIDYLFDFERLDRDERLDTIFKYKNFISCSVYTGSSFNQLWRILEIVGSP
jgi:hypothetical protein